MSDADTKVLHDEPEPMHQPEYYEPDKTNWRKPIWIPWLVLLLILTVRFIAVPGSIDLMPVLFLIAGLVLVPWGSETGRTVMAAIGLVAVVIALLLSFLPSDPSSGGKTKATHGNYGSSQSEATAAVSTGTMTSSASAEPTTVVASETPSPSATPEPTTAVTTSAKPKPSATKAAVKTTEPPADSFPQQVAPEPTSDPQPSVATTPDSNDGANRSRIPQPG